MKGFYEDYPGIHVLEGKTLTISGDGSLNASGNGSGSCGDITITDGVTSVTATNSIGAGENGSCGTVTITAAAGKVTQN